MKRIPIEIQMSIEIDDGLDKRLQAGEPKAFDELEYSLTVQLEAYKAQQLSILNAGEPNVTLVKEEE